jgi:hypothetical protein
VRFIANKSNNHAVEVEEEHEQVETKLDERFLNSVSMLSNHECECRVIRSLPQRCRGCSHRVSDLLMDIELPKDLCCIQEVLVLENPIIVSTRTSVAEVIGSAHTSCRSKPTMAGSE